MNEWDHHPTKQLPLVVLGHFGLCPADGRPVACLKGNPQFWTCHQAHALISPQLIGDVLFGLPLLVFHKPQTTGNFPSFYQKIRLSQDKPTWYFFGSEVRIRWSLLPLFVISLIFWNVTCNAVFLPRRLPSVLHDEWSKSASNNHCNSVCDFIEPS